MKNIKNFHIEKKANIEKKEISNKNKNQTTNVITSNHIYYNSQNNENKNQIINKGNKNNKIIEMKNIINKKKENEKIENKIKNVEKNNDISNEDDENDKILNEIIKTVYHQNKKNEKKKRHISFNLGNKKEESNKVINSRQKLPSDQDLFQNLIEKINKNKGNLLPFKKEDIIIDKDYVSAELKDEFELFNKKRKTNKNNNKSNYIKSIKNKE